MSKKKVITGDLTNCLGERGESIVYLALTDFSQFKKPLFLPAFLGAKWPTADFYAELLEIKNHRPVVLFQVKTSANGISTKTKSIHVTLSKKDVQLLSKIPIPAYVLGVSEKSKQVFVRAIAKDRTKGISAISANNELTPTRLKELHTEIAMWWKTPKKITSKFL